MGLRLTLASLTTVCFVPVTTMVNSALSRFSPTARESIFAPTAKHTSHCHNDAHALTIGWICLILTYSKLGLHLLLFDWLTPPGKYSCHPVDHATLVCHKDRDDMLVLALWEHFRVIDIYVITSHLET